MKNLTVIFCLLFFFKDLNAQDSLKQKKDTIVYGSAGAITLPNVMVRNNFDYIKVLQQIKEDTTFYKAFRNLRILNYSSYNDIKMMDKKGSIKASLYGKTKQIRSNGCRTMQVLEEQTTGDFYTSRHNYNYLTAELYASLFFTDGYICGENNIVKGKQASTANTSGISKHKEQLKTLFFNPGKKIPGIPFIGDKLDLYDEHARKYYDYKLDIEEYNGTLCYIFSILPKEDLSNAKQNDIVVDAMVTRFDMQSLQVLTRTYSLSYKAGVYDFDVTMEVEMMKFDDLYVPRVLRYRGNWDVIFKKRERGIFTATLFDFKKE
ncbi:MAG: hypothetical protein J0I09_14090 [Sphingobacteriia bacterium]|nr:hypothetical protein [Sphingobacteriia bacterium]